MVSTSASQEDDSRFDSQVDQRPFKSEAIQNCCDVIFNVTRIGILSFSPCIEPTNKFKSCWPIRHRASSLMTRFCFRSFASGNSGSQPVVKF